MTGSGNGPDATTAAAVVETEAAATAAVAVETEAAVAAAVALTAETGVPVVVLVLVAAHRAMRRCGLTRHPAAAQ